MRTFCLFVITIAALLRPVAAQDVPLKLPVTAGLTTTPARRPDVAPDATITRPTLPKFKSVISAERIRPHVEFLAGDALRGRRGADATRAAEYLQAHFQRCGLQPLFEDSYLQPIPGPPREDGTKTQFGQNVGAWLPGSDPELKDEYIIVSAHFDHLGVREGEIHPGADDNASGTALMLEIASELSRLKTPPKRSVVFIGFDLEEYLLWGSRWFTAHAPWPLEKVKLFMTADMIGRQLGDLPISTVFVLGSEHGTGLRELLDDIGEPEDLHVARLGIDLVGTRSDYGPFRDQKVPFLFFSTGEHPDYHRPTDRPDRVLYDQVAGIATLALNITTRAANDEQAPEWVAEIEPQVDEARAVHRIAMLLLETRGDKELNNFQRFIVTNAEIQTRQIIERGRMTPEERTALIRTAQILLFSVL